MLLSTLYKPSVLENCQHKRQRTQRHGASILPASPSSTHTRTRKMCRYTYCKFTCGHDFLERTVVCRDFEISNGTRCQNEIQNAVNPAPDGTIHIIPNACPRCVAYHRWIARRLAEIEPPAPPQPTQEERQAAEALLRAAQEAEQAIEAEDAAEALLAMRRRDRGGEGR